MPNEFSESDLAQVRLLIENSTLRTIDFYEVSARRYDAAPSQEIEEDEGRLSIDVQQRTDSDSFGIRLLVTATMPVGEATASVAGEYDLLNDHQPTQRTLQIFTNEVGVMTVFPYLREAISTATSKVFGEPLLLPTVQRGEIAVDVDEP